MKKTQIRHLFEDDTGIINQKNLLPRFAFPCFGQKSKRFYVERFLDKTIWSLLKISEQTGNLAEKDERSIE